MYKYITKRERYFYKFDMSTPKRGGGGGGGGHDGFRICKYPPNINPVFYFYHSRWPAVVSPDPWSDGDYISDERVGCIYHIEFLGKMRTHSWVPEEEVKLPYTVNLEVKIFSYLVTATKINLTKTRVHY